MTLVRERRHQQPLKLSLPPPTPIPAIDFHRKTHHSPTLSATSPHSPDFESLSDFEKVAVLGQGNGSTVVYKVRHRKNSSLYALKVIRFDKDATTIRRQAVEEADILKRVYSPYIIRCYAVFDNEDGLCFVMEYMDRGSLQDVLNVHKVLPEDVISGVARSVLQGLEYLYGLQIVHGDIKPSNLLINSNGDVKIADFGVSKVVGKPDSIAHEADMGTAAYMSPERFDTESCVNGFPGDVWSLGVVVLECLVGHYPLIGYGELPDWAALICAICFRERVETPENASADFGSFVRSCLEKDWRKRGSVNELLNHPFVRNTCGSVQGLVGFSFHD